MNAIELAEWLKESDKHDIDYGYASELVLIEAELRRLHADNEALKKENSGYIGALARCRDECGFSVDDIHESISMGDPLAVPDFVIEQVNALRKDAARYRWLAGSMDGDSQCDFLDLVNMCVLDREHFDRAIDAAMEQSK